MIPSDNEEILVARFTFVSHVHPQYPVITMTRKKHSPSASMTVVRDWFDRIISTEKAKLPRNAVLRYAEYRIQTGDAELFKLDGSCFDKILLVLGGEYSYWTFYKNMPLLRRIEGDAVLPITFCPCCFQSHYQKVMKAIKDSFCKTKTVDKT